MCLEFLLNVNQRFKRWCAWRTEVVVEIGARGFLACSAAAVSRALQGGGAAGVAATTAATGGIIISNLWILHGARMKRNGQ